MTDLMYGWSSEAQRFRDLRTGLCDVRPALSKDNQGHRSTREAEFLADFGLPYTTCNSSPNVADYIFSQCCLVVLLTTKHSFLLGQLGRANLPCWSMSSPLRPHVVDVVLNSAQKQVLRTDAGRVVALVKNPEAVRDGSEVNLPGELVCANTPIALAPKRNVPVSVSSVGAAVPGPARTEVRENDRAILDDLVPEPCLDWPSLRSPSTSATAIGADYPRYVGAADGAWLGRLTTHRDDLPVSRGAMPPDVGASRGHFDVMIIPSSLGGSHD